MQVSRFRRLHGKPRAPSRGERHRKTRGWRPNSAAAIRTLTTHRHIWTVPTFPILTTRRPTWIARPDLLTTNRGLSSVLLVTFETSHCHVGRARALQAIHP